ncbi:hypothetical protein ACJX0J_042119, partial [Zea mays]
YLIPKGWKVLPLFRNIHHSPDHFPCPDKFDPSRFEVQFNQQGVGIKSIIALDHLKIIFIGMVKCE